MISDGLIIEAKQIKVILGLLLFLGIGLMAFWPALTGPFLFDDFPVLQSLGTDGGIDDLNKLGRFSLSHESPLGRPLSMLSFAINAQDWPADPSSFKYTNLLLHLLNGILVFVFATQIARILQREDEKNAEVIGLFSMALWMLHPMQLSTMMLVVQRMTELMATFTLCGLIIYLYGRKLIDQNPVQSIIFMSIGIVFFGILSILSKETGLILPVYILVLEFSLLKKPLTNYRLWIISSGIFLIFPAFLIVIYLSVIPFLTEGYIIREFTLFQRILTEFRVLIDYLFNIILPKLSGSGIFYDNYLISKSFFQPISTVLSFLLILGMIFIGLYIRKCQPVLTFAIFWFLLGHILEATSLPLEIYFEHRNYLPMLGPVFAIVYYIFLLIKKGDSLKIIASSTLLFLVGLYVFLSYQSSMIWGNKGLMAEIWSKNNPTSSRALELAADYWDQQGNFEKSNHYRLEAIKKDPKELGNHLQIVFIDCIDDKLDRSKIELAINNSIEEVNFSYAVVEILRRLRIQIMKNTCPELEDNDLQIIIDNLLKNKKYKFVYSDLLFEKSLLHVKKNEKSLAINFMEKSYALKPKPESAIFLAGLLISVGNREQALSYIHLAKGNEGLSLREKIRQKLFPISLDLSNLENLAKNLPK